MKEINVYIYGLENGLLILEGDEGIVEIKTENSAAKAYFEVKKDGKVIHQEDKTFTLKDTVKTFSEAEKQIREYLNNLYN